MSADLSPAVFGSAWPSRWLGLFGRSPNQAAVRMNARRDRRLSAAGRTRTRNVSRNSGFTLCCCRQRSLNRGGYLGFSVFFAVDRSSLLQLTRPHRTRPESARARHCGNQSARSTLPFRDRFRTATLDNAAAFSADGVDYREYGNAFRRNDVDP